MIGVPKYLIEKNIYISTECFEESRKDLVEWYKRYT